MKEDFEDNVLRYFIAFCFIILALCGFVLIAVIIYGILMSGPIAWIVITVFTYTTVKFANSRIFRRWYKEF